jgi:hypothetical protein
MELPKPCVRFLACLSYFIKRKVCLWDRHAVSEFSPTPQLLNAWTNLGTWGHLSSVLHKSHQSVCLYVYSPIVARQRLHLKALPRQRKHAIEELLAGSFPSRSVSYQKKDNYFLPYFFLQNKGSFFCYVVIPFYLQSVLVHSANCVKTYTVACRRVLGSAPL